MTYIYVMYDGFVLVGRPQPQQRGDDPRFVKLNDIAVIREWGTTRGLGQLAMEGPTEMTKFDPEPDGTEINTGDIKRKLPCVEEVWKKWTLSK